MKKIVAILSTLVVALLIALVSSYSSQAGEREIKSTGGAYLGKFKFKEIDPADALLDVERAGRSLISVNAGYVGNSTYREVWRFDDSWMVYDKLSGDFHFAGGTFTERNAAKIFCKTDVEQNCDDLKSNKLSRNLIVVTYRHRATGAACAGLDYIDEENYSEGYGASYGDYTVFVNTCIPASDDYEEALARSAHYLSLVKKDGRPIARLSRYDLPKLDTGRETNLRGDHTAKLRDLRPLAEQGDANAQYNLGQIYRRGQGVPKDPTEAAKWFRLAAKQGHADSQLSLGILYWVGFGVPEDYAEAVKLYRLAAKQGHPGAQHTLGKIYRAGQSEVPQDYAEAVKWFRLAAEQGRAGSQYFLGSLYEKGQGVPQDYVEAYKWIILAAAQGNKAAKRRRDIIATKLSPGQITEAQRKASKWLEDHPQ